MSKQLFQSTGQRLGWLLLCFVLAGTAIVTVATAVAHDDPQLTDPQNRIWGDPHVSLVVDTRASMASELNALNEAWSPQNLNLRPLTATYHLAAFKESQAIYRDNTQNPMEFNNWLSQLEASGGEGCQTAALPGIMASLRNLPNSKMPSSDLLLITDGTPQGSRQNYAYVLDRLQRRGVRWHILSSGWCNEGQPTLEQVSFLAEKTGGSSFAPLKPAEYLTETIITLNQLLANDTIVNRKGIVNNETAVIPFQLDNISDFRIETTTGSWVGCLTCTRPANVPTEIQFTLFDPNGQNFVDAASPYLTLLETSGRTQLSYTGCLTCPFTAGEWQLQVSGSGEYEVNVKANTDFHMANLSQPKAAVDKATPIVVALGSSPHEAAEADALPGVRNHSIRCLTCTFRLIPLNGGVARPLTLFDDGKNNDGLPNDGIYGGEVTINQPGLWQLEASGVLSSGTELEPFMRTDPTPMQFKRMRTNQPDSVQQLAGSTRTVNFSLTNSSDDPARAAQTMSFDIGVYSEQGWVVTDTVPLSVTLAPDETVTIPVEVVVPADAPAGAVEETTFVAVPTDDFTDSSTAVAETTVIDEVRIYLPLLSK